MTKRLFICETPFQVLASILIIFDSKDTGKNDFIVASTMRGAKEISHRLAQIDFVNDSHTEKENTKADLNSNYYDEFYCRNFTFPYTEKKFKECKKNNRIIKTYIIDEGYSQYTHDFWNSFKNISLKHKLYDYLKIGKKYFITNNITSAKFFAPNLLHFDICYAKERMLSNNFDFTNEEIQKINYVFNYSSDIDYKNKYLYFEESFYKDFGINDDLDLINSFANIVGKENILIKLHPRSTENRFTPLGYHVLESVSYPAEVLAINNRIEPLTFISYSSGALLNYLFFGKSKIKSILLFDLANRFGNMNNPEVEVWFREFATMHPNNIFIPKNKKELLTELVNG